MRRWKGLGLGKRTATLQFWGRCSCCASSSSCRRGHAARPHAMLFQFTVMLNCVQNTSTLVAALEDPCDTAATLLSFAANSSIMTNVGQRGLRCSCTCRRMHERAVERLHPRPGAGGGVEPLAEVPARDVTSAANECCRLALIEKVDGGGEQGGGSNGSACICSAVVGRFQPHEPEHDVICAVVDEKIGGTALTRQRRARAEEFRHPVWRRISAQYSEWGRVIIIMMAATAAISDVVIVTIIMSISYPPCDSLQTER
jgi:hypothetical protein